MEQLKVAFLESDQRLDFSLVGTRSKFRNLAIKGLIFALLFALVMTGFILVVSLTYQPVPPERTPGYRFNQTLYFKLGPHAPAMLAQEIDPSIVMMGSLNLRAYNWTTTCANLTFLDDQAYHILLTLDVTQIGCEVNVTLDIEMFPGQSGTFTLVNLDGFVLQRELYPPGQGDVILQTTGIVGQPFHTALAWRILTGTDGQNIIINTADNNILELYIDWSRIYLFALAVSGWIWKLVNIPLWGFWQWRRGEKTLGNFVQGPQGLTVEV